MLRLQRVGPRANFFDLGGHSLLAAQVISRVRDAFHAELTIHDMFNAPTVAELAQRIEAGRRAARGSAAPLLRRLPQGAEPVLSFAQERLWFLEQLQPGIPFHNIPLAVRLEGDLDGAALEHALSEIIRRHKPLRTAFCKAAGRPAAVITAASRFPIPPTDLSHLPAPERLCQAQGILEQEARAVFDLMKAPLGRARLLRLSPREHLLAVTLHHISSDGWSVGLFYQEMKRFYEAAVHRDSPELEALRVEYADFARWQRALWDGGFMERQFAYWKRQLAGLPPALELPTDHPRPPVRRYRGAVQTIELPRPPVAALKALAAREDATLFMALVAVFQVWMHRYSGETDLPVGSPVAGRSRVETERLQGLFLNMIVLRGGLSGNPSFREVLRRVRRTALEAYANQDVPFEKIVEELQSNRDLSRSPLFQVMLVLQNDPLPPLALSGLKLTPVPIHSGTAKYDLTLSLEEQGDRLSGYLEYDTDLFEAGTIRRMAGHFQTLLESVARSPEQSISTVSWLPEAERRQLLMERNPVGSVPGGGDSIHQLIEAQAARTPDHIAAAFGDAQLTYRELNRRANRLAHRLRRLGVGPEVIVGVCLERSLEMLVGLLGILKAGGAYEPLDASFPDPRLAWMIEDSRASVLLTQASWRARLQSLQTASRIATIEEEEWPQPAEWAERPGPNTPPGEVLEDNPASGTTGDHLAYLMFTSGSTGKPKAVMVTHRNVVSFFAAMEAALGPEPGVWLALTNITFDISVLELLWTLTRGYKVVIHRHEWHSLERRQEKEGARFRTRSDSSGHSLTTSPARIRPDGNAIGTQAPSRGTSLADQIARHGVTHLQCTPSTAKILLAAPETVQALARVRKVLIGGEAFPAGLAAQLPQDCEVFNLYGPTEATVWSAIHQVRPGEDPVPIGRPLANTRIYILDKHLQPVPAGVPGELFIGGDGIARGYFNRPDLTVERFIASPFDDHPESRLYRTGDLGRFRPNGDIEFLGRRDHQVKILGHRVELEEIESILAEHPALHQVVVTTKDHPEQDERLIAFVVPAAKRPALETDVKRFLRARLPAHMIPTQFVVLDALPLTAAGKVDRKALRVPEQASPASEPLSLEPGGAIEATVSALWKDLLGVDQVAVGDNFFDLGGNSLLVVRLQARLREVLGMEVSVIALFQHPTVGSLAELLRGTESTPDLSTVQARAARQRAALARGKPARIAA